MARLKLSLPGKFIYSTEIPLRITDINYGGHLGNDAVLSIVHEARVRFLKEYGFSELNVGDAGIIMSDAVIVFSAEAFYGDVLEVKVTASELGNISCDFFYQLINKKSGTEIARAKTGIVFFDYEKRKPVKIPDVFLSTIGTLIQ